MRFVNVECPHCNKIQERQWPDNKDTIFINCLYCKASLSVKIKPVITEILVLGKPGLEEK